MPHCGLKRAIDTFFLNFNRFSKVVLSELWTFKDDKRLKRSTHNINTYASNLFDITKYNF